MKRIGLIGGLSWESTRTYYDVINTEGCNILGGMNNPEILMYSVNLARVYPYLEAERYGEVLEYLSMAAKTLENAGADMILICANTPHILADEIQDRICVPLIHIVDALAHNIKEKRLKTVALLGTPVTMERNFYRGRLEDNHGIATVIPDRKYHEGMINIISGELDRGIIKKQSLEFFMEVIGNCEERGAEGIVLGCTEIPLLVKDEHCKLPVFDTATLHGRYAVKLANI